MKDITITTTTLANFVGKFNRLMRDIRAFDARNGTDNAIEYQDALEMYLDFFGLAPVFEPEDDLEDANEVLIDIIQAQEV